MSQTLLEMTKDLVMAQIQAKTLPPEEMHQALQGYPLKAGQFHDVNL
jgi:hypothetical protein